MGKNYLKKYCRKLNIKIINQEKVFDRSAHINMDGFVGFIQKEKKQLKKGFNDQMWQNDQLFKQDLCCVFVYIYERNSSGQNSHCIFTGSTRRT